MKRTLRRFFPLVGVPVTTALAWTVPSQAAQSGRAVSDPALVTKVTLQSESLPPAMICPATLRFRGTVIAATAGVVRYRFRLDDGPATPYVDMTMKEKEARDVVHLLRIGSAANTAVRGTLQFEVRGSRGAQRATASFAVTCERETENTKRRIRSRPLERDTSGRAATHWMNSARGGSATMSSCGRCERHRTSLAPAPRCQIRPLPTRGPWSSDWSDQHRRASDAYRDRPHEQSARVPGYRRRDLAIYRRRQTLAARRTISSRTFASVAINPATRPEVFAGGGDPNFHSAVTSGVGIWRSTANGDPGTWTKVSPPALDGRVIYRLRIDPSAPNAVYAATSDGVVHRHAIGGFHHVCAIERL